MQGDMLLSAQLLSAVKSLPDSQSTMLSLLAKFVMGVWQWSKDPQLKEPDIPPDIVKEKSFIGIVTNLNTLEEYGLIDNEVFFNFSVIYSKKTASIGDSVIVRASRKEQHHSWTATYVEIQRKPQIRTSSNMSSSNADFHHSKSSIYKMNGVNNNIIANVDVSQRVDTIEQVVSECNGQSGKLKGGFEFLVESGEIDFKPVVGDILFATVVYVDGRKLVTSWKPKEIKCVDGEVTAYESNCGVIDNDIVFLRNHCRRKVNLYVGQKVSAMIVSSEQGIFKWRAFSLSTSFDEENVSTPKPILDNKEGLLITEELNFRQIFLGHRTALTIEMQNMSSDCILFLGCQFHSKSKIFYLGQPSSGIQSIPENSSLSLTIHCKTESIGQHEDNLLLEFPDVIVKRSIIAHVVDPMQHVLKPTAPFSRKVSNQRNQFQDDGIVIIPGKKPYKPISKFANKLPPSNIPRSLIRAVENREDVSYMIPCLTQNLNMRNYVSKFQTLLHLEEIQVRIDTRKFDMHESMLYRKGEFLSLEVSGLAEGRPSLIIGDKALLVPPYSKSSFAFEGYIHEVHLNNILLKFSDSFQNSYGGESFDVHFELNRTNFKRMHQCVHHVAENHDYALFPNKLLLKEALINLDLPPTTVCVANGKHFKRIPKSTIEWKNEKLNWKQKEAVSRILECRGRPLPYIIFGPPGTGKTITLVEAVLQVYEKIKHSRIVICTPSNSAADLVAQRIIETELIDTSNLIRLNSYQRSIESIPEFIKDYCQDKDSLDYLESYRIIISTCSTAGSLYTIGLCNNFFTHVFIDEAGQLSEPESDIAVGFIDSDTVGQVVMAGDPQQLGPVLRSTLAISYGLQKSFLERLMSTALYERNEDAFRQYGGYNPMLITMLEESYRSHPDILRFPSDMFYFSQVICRFSPNKTCDLGTWGELPNKRFPVIFHGIKGEELREETSPSWFNSAEVVQVCMYLRKLYDFGLTSEDVGIIAPYKKQVEKIRFFLSCLSQEVCKIGSVEEFQGQERRAIIISTVRSSDQFVNCDILYNLGFMSNPKRLNVAITRSQELLIVVGNPYVLSKDFYWHSFVRYCVVNGCYIGCELPLSFIQNGE